MGHFLLTILLGTGLFLLPGCGLSTQACKALRELGYRIVLVNSNPATIMTDPGMADVTYIEPLNVETLEKIIARERPDALLTNLGGQAGQS